LQRPCHTIGSRDGPGGNRYSTFSQLRHGTLHAKTTKMDTQITTSLQHFGDSRQPLPPRPPNLTSFAWDNFSIACRLAFVKTWDSHSNTNKCDLVYLVLVPPWFEHGAAPARCSLQHIAAIAVLSCLASPVSQKRSFCVSNTTLKGVNEVKLQGSTQLYFSEQKPGQMSVSTTSFQ
jgi:hypothetical protein